MVTFYLPFFRLLSGESIGAVCLADKYCGSDPMMTKVKAVFDDFDDCYILNGTKTWVSNASSADVFTVFANLKAIHMSEGHQVGQDKFSNAESE